MYNKKVKNKFDKKAMLSKLKEKNTVSIEYVRELTTKIVNKKNNQSFIILDLKDIFPRYAANPQINK